MAKARVTCGNVTVEGEDQKEIFSRFIIDVRSIDNVIELKR